MSTTKSKILFISKWAGIAIATVVAYLFFFEWVVEKRPFLEWIMVNVNSKDLQADSHILKMPNGKIFLIDCGDTENTLLPFLKKQKIRDIEKVLISHMHKDHYGALSALLATGIRIKEVRLNLPSKENCLKEVPWGCDWEHIQTTLEDLKKHGVAVLSEKAGDVYYDDQGLKLEVLYAFDGMKTPIGLTDVNDMSVIIRVSQGKTRLLFTGDLNAPMGAYLATNFPNELTADVLKIPHHGTESVVPNSFLDAVAPKIAFIPSPKSLWESDRSKRIREYVQNAKIPFYVNGIHGHVKLLLHGEVYKVKTAR